MREEPADLAAVMFDGVDKLQHLCWRFIDPACRPERPTPWEQEMIELCERTSARWTRCSRELVALAGPGATVVLASDHGFGPTREVFHVNSVAGAQGLPDLGRRATRRRAGDGTDVGFAEMTRHIHALDWERTRGLRGDARAARASTSSAACPAATRRCPSDVRAQLMDELAAGLRELRRPHDGRPLVDEVWTRDRAFAGPYEASAPTSRWCWPTAGRCRSCPPTRSSPGAPSRAGTTAGRASSWRPDPVIRAGARVDELSIVDVAPLLLHRLGLPVPDDMAGSVPVEIFEPASWSGGRRGTPPPPGARRARGRRPTTSSWTPRSRPASWSASAPSDTSSDERRGADAKAVAAQRDPAALPAGRARGPTW